MFSLMIHITIVPDDTDNNGLLRTISFFLMTGLYCLKTLLHTIIAAISIQIPDEKFYVCWPVGCLVNVCAQS